MASKKPTKYTYKERIELIVISTFLHAIEFRATHRHIRNIHDAVAQRLC